MTDESETTYGLHGPGHEARLAWGLGFAERSRTPAAVAQVEEHPGAPELLTFAGRPPTCRTV